MVEIVDRDSQLTITIRRAQRFADWFQTVMVFLIWLLAEQTLFRLALDVMWEAVNQDPNTEVGPRLLVLGMWTAVGLALGYWRMWVHFGQEVLQVDHSALTVVRQALLFRRQEKYLRAQIDNLGVSPFWPGGLAFRYNDPQTQQSMAQVVARGISPEESRKVIWRIQEKFPYHWKR
ncbi:MAG: hypothetical protein GYB68_11135 [Chloroflexi bacterium]|nr:hypothetical protein [Chloroflexota bacterium]